MSIQSTINITREDAIEHLAQQSFEAIKDSYIKTMKSKYERLSNDELEAMLEEEFFNYQICEEGQS